MSSNEYADRLLAAARFMRENDDFLVVSHVQPDGDAAGSTFAVAWMLRELGKTFTLINEGPIPGKFMYMAEDIPVVNYETDPPGRQFRRIIAVDCADPDRIGRVRECFAPDAELLNIDHHATNGGFGHWNLVKADAAATVEVLYDLGEALGIAFSQPLNVCIYSGLLTDTGGFRYSSTTPKVMRIAADLLARGVQGHELAERLLETMTRQQVSLLKNCLSSLSFAAGGRIAWLSVTLDDLKTASARNEDMEGLVNYARNVEGVEVGLLFKEKGPGLVKVSLRSSGTVNVAEVAASFGGGGHVRAAGCTVAASLPDAVDKVVKEVEAAMA